MRPDGPITRFKERWQALDQNRKIIAVLITLGLVVSLFFLIRLAFQPSYANLFTGLEPKDAGTIAEKLKAMNVPYKLTEQGKTIQVPESKVYEVRNELASSGVLADSGIGFELFDESKFGQTDFEQQVGYQRALQEELRRTLIQLEGVDQARVHLVLPQKSVFVTSDEGTASASVALRLKPGATLKPAQVQGICDLLVGSVEGLKPENVHIIDTAGNTLSDSLKSTDPDIAATRLALEQYNAQREYEKELEKRVRQMLFKIVGDNQAVVMVTADLDFSQTQTTSNTYSNPDDLIISEHNIRESGTGTGYGGIPGTGSNVTTMPTAGIGTSSYEREESTINYQVNAQQQTVIEPPGRIRRLSASVVINDTGMPVDVQEVRNIVGAAIGYEMERGDQINVTDMAFDNSYQQRVEEEMARLDAMAQARERERLYMLAAAAGVLLLGLLLVVLLRRRRSRVEEEVVVDEFVPVKAMELEPEPEQIEEDDKKQKLRELGKESVDEIAEILKAWIRN
ncbi:MAG: flagellar M-ring protein FliF [Peptococcaceae bacterium]|nr:flagellar M-ring protein FliF [Peptococcaceae bacterium]